ncbi:MAG: hypothetical protein WDO16_00855 [Bacteroidota bacterium]
MQQASALLPLNWFNSTTNSNAFPGRLTSGAANTLWAQTYLARQNWARVLALTNIVIGSTEYSLAAQVHRYLERRSGRNW